MTQQPHQLPEIINAKKHLGITGFACFFLGTALGFEQLGVKAGVEYWFVISIWIAGCVTWLVTVFTSLEKLKRFIRLDKEIREQLSQAQETIRALEQQNAELKFRIDGIEK